MVMAQRKHKGYSAGHKNAGYARKLTEVVKSNLNPQKADTLPNSMWTVIAQIWYTVSDARPAVNNT